MVFPHNKSWFSSLFLCCGFWKYIWSNSCRTDSLDSVQNVIVMLRGASTQNQGEWMVVSGDIFAQFDKGEGKKSSA